MFCHALHAVDVGGRSCGGVLAMKRVEWIDQAKGIAILMVVAVHLSQAVSLPQAVDEAASFGAMGVQLFFLMSAYCACMTWRPERFDGWYWWRKYKRLAGWYLIGVLVYWGYWTHCGNAGMLSAYTFGNIAANVVFLNGFVPSAQNSIVPGGWSISCIALFVFSYPLLARLTDRLLAIVLIGMGVAGCLLSFVGYKCLGWSRFFSYCVPVNQIMPFAIGIFFYHKRNWLLHHLPSWGAATLSLLFFCLTVIAVRFDRENAIFYRQILISASFMFALLLLGGGYGFSVGSDGIHMRFLSFISF